jgi:hypothetical protein
VRKREFTERNSITIPPNQRDQANITIAGSALNKPSHP